MRYEIALLSDARLEIERRKAELASDVQAIIHATELLRSTPGASVVLIETDGALVAELGR